MTQENGGGSVQGPTAAEPTTHPQHNDATPSTASASTPTSAGTHERLRRAWAAAPDTPGREAIASLAYRFEVQRQRGYPRLRPHPAAYAVALDRRYAPDPDRSAARQRRASELEQEAWSAAVGHLAALGYDVRWAVPDRLSLKLEALGGAA